MAFIIKINTQKKEYEKLLIIQRDHYDVTVEKLIINELAIGKENDSIFLKTNLISIDKASAAIYRDKFEKEEDLRLKKLYSRAIRELPIKTDGRFSFSLKIVPLSIQRSYSNNIKQAYLRLKLIMVGSQMLAIPILLPERTVIIVDRNFHERDSFQCKLVF